MAAKRRTTKDDKRRCSRCQKFKPRDAFPRNRAMADGLGVYCRECKREADRQRLRSSRARAQAEAQAPTEHPAGTTQGDAQSSERLRAPALAITDELIERAAALIRDTGATRRAAARKCGVSENTFKSWLREAGDLKDDEDPRRRLLFAIELAEGEAEFELTQAYWAGTKLDAQVAQRFLERRFSKGDEKWARTEHVSVTDGDSSAMETTDARKLLAEKLGKLILVAPVVAVGSAAGPGGSSSGTGPADGASAASSAEAPDDGGTRGAPPGAP